MEPLRDSLNRITRFLKESLGITASGTPPDRPEQPPLSRALLVSHDPDAQHWIADYTDPGWQASLASDPTEAIELLAVEHYDLIAVDLDTLDASPATFIQELRAYRQVPIVVLAPRTGQDRIAEALAAGADDYIYADGNPDFARFVLRHTVDRVQLMGRYQEERPDTGRDFLTGADSQRAFAQVYDEWVTRCRQTGESLVVIRLAVEDLQTINTAYGTHAGDAVLQEVARMLRRAVRRTDSVARLGGGQFALLLPGPGGRRAEQVANQVRELAAEHRFPERPDLRIRLRVGWAAIGQDDDPLMAAEQRMDSATPSVT
jgi:diguanylate cyclase (GGDEF)-like protein